MIGRKVTFSAGNDFTPLEMGVYQTQITDVNLKTQPKFHSTETEEVIEYEFSVLTDQKLSDGTSSKGRLLWHKCRTSLNPKSWLAKLAVAVMGREMTDDEKENFDQDSLVGKQVNCMVTQNPSKDGTRIWNNILAFSKVTEPMAPVTDDKGVSVAPPVATKSVVPTVAPETATEAEIEDASGEDVDAEIALLEAQAKVAAAKAKAAKAKK